MLCFPIRSLISLPERAKGLGTIYTPIAGGRNDYF
jgi:hypothetical protein